ncbi:MAG: extracellular solute-binding protein [Ilumatobacteraceae bacterium]
MNRRLTLSSALLISLVALGSSCGEDEADLTIYSGRTDDLIGPILDDFSKETGIKVEVKYGQSADLALLLDEEAEAGRDNVDVFISQSPGAMGYLEDRGRLATLPSNVLELVPTEVRDDEERWVGLTGRQRVLVYNSDLLDAESLPSSVFDLTDPEWKGRIGVAPGNGSFQDFVTAMRITEGDDATIAFLEGLAANDPVTYENNNAIVEAVARGEVEVGLVNHYYNYRRLVEVPDSPTANHVFDEGDPGALLIITGIAILEGADGNEDALKLVEWLLGVEAQKYFADETFEYPLAIGSTPSSGIPSITFADVGGIDFSDLGAGLQRTREMITEAGLAG